MVTDAPGLASDAVALAGDRLRRRIVGLALFVVLALAVPCVADQLPMADAQIPAALADAQRLFDQAQYRYAADVLEAVIAAQPDHADAVLLLGKTWGRLAEQRPWLEAIALARRCGRTLERAVELAPSNREALLTLARFYEDAPSIVGGSAEKAQQLRERLRALEQ